MPFLKQIWFFVKKTNYKFILFVLFSSFAAGGYAQESTTVAGGTVESSEGSMTVTMGLVFYQTFTDIHNNIEEQGLQHAYEIYPTIADGGIVSIYLSPNPTIGGETFLHVKGLDFKNLYYYLFVEDGRLVNINPILQQDTKVDLSKLTSSAYVISVVYNKKFIKSIKLIKK